MNTLVRALPAMLSLLPALVGQEAARTSFGVTTHDGVLQGLGPAYSARFEAKGITFAPLLGDPADVPATLRFVLDSVHRGGTPVFQRGRDIAPMATDNQVRYVHDGNLVEVYDVRQDGIEQSFVFAQRPAGTGDLVVRGEITTELRLAAVNDDGARFERRGSGVITIGGVTGVDANGARMRGSLRCDGRWLELSLPASFVESATYPLVLDPLIGSPVSLSAAANASISKPAAAFDVSTGRYLVVWSVLNTVREVRGQLVDSNGAAIGGTILIEAGSPGPLTISTVSLESCSVANINSANRFLVAWRVWNTGIGLNSYELAAKLVNASNGAVSNQVSLWSSSFPLHIPVDTYAIAGNRLATGTNSNVTWVLMRAIGLHAIKVQVGTTGDPVVLSDTPLSQFDPRDVAITQDGGSVPRWLMSWTQLATSGGAPTLVRAQLLGGSGPCGSPFTLFTAAAGDQVAGVTCATANGTNFLVGWSNTLGGADDLQVTSLTSGGVCASPTMVQGDVLTLPLAAGLQDQPALAYANGKYVLAWRSRSTTSTPGRVRIMGLNPISGAPAGADLQLDVNLYDQETPGIASRTAGGDTGNDESLVVWSSGSLLRSRRFETFGVGGVQSLGGACGIPGLSDVATYNGTPVLGTTFTIELLAPTAPVLALIVGFSQNPFACGPCTIVPSADILLAGGGPVPISVPLDANLIGFELFTQWLQLRPSGCPILPAFGFSNTLKFTIAE